MSENKTTLPPEQIKLQEEKEKKQKALVKAKADTDTARAKVQDAQGAFDEAAEDKKEAAKEVLEDAKVALQKSVDAEEASRVSYAQSGSFLPDPAEKHLFHVKLDKTAYDPKSGKKLSKAHIQIFTEAEWNSFEKNSAGLGYTTDIMWNPIDYKS